MLGWYSHFRVAFRAHRSLTELAWNASRAEQPKLGAQAEETQFSLLDIFFDLNADRKTLQLRLRYHRANVNDFLEGQRQPIRFQLVAPLMLVQ